MRQRGSGCNEIYLAWRVVFLYAYRNDKASVNNDDEGNLNLRESYEPAQNTPNLAYPLQNERKILSRSICCRTKDMAGGDSPRTI